MRRFVRLTNGFSKKLAPQVQVAIRDLPLVRKPPPASVRHPFESTFEKVIPLALLRQREAPTGENCESP